MLNSMWSGVSGLRTHQQGMDVIGNDIANVNTTAYKQSNITFQDALYKTLLSPQQGTSGKQVGIGATVSKISADFGSGALQQTDVSTHMALTGDGFFVMKDATGTNTSYTRAGDFQFAYDDTAAAGSNLYLMGPDGKYLYGTAGGTAGSGTDLIALPADMQEMMVSGDGVISYIDSTGALQENVFTIDVATFPSAEGLLRTGGNQYETTPASGAAQFGVADTKIMQGHLENSNVDLAKEFTEMIVTERGFQANSKIITTSDSMLQELLNLKR